MILDDESSFSDSETTDGLLLEYPEPFKGNYGDNVHDFIEKVESALNYNRVPASSKVTVLKKLVKGGRAEWSVYDWESFNDNVKRLKTVFGDPYVIWKKTKDDFLQRSREEFGNWTDHFSPEREEMLWKLSNFLSSAENLSTNFESLKGEVFSDDTYKSIVSVLPHKLIYKIYEKVATTEIVNGTLNSSFTTFKNIQEVLSNEINVAAVASRYYDVIAEKRRLLGQTREDLDYETFTSTYESFDEDSDTKTDESKDAKNLALRNFERHFQRISRNARLKKNIYVSSTNFLTKSQQVVVKFKNVLSRNERSDIFNKMNKVKSLNVKMGAKIKNVAQQGRKPYKKSRPMGQRIVPQVRQKRISKLDKNNEQEVVDLMFPEVPNETFESVKAEVENLGSKGNSRDEDIERRLTKLKFFNQSWLKNIPETRSRNTDISHKSSSTGNNAANDDDVPAADSIKEECAAEHHDLDVIEVVPEPVVSTKEEIDAFNSWYLRKISESNIPKKSNSRFLSPSCAITEEMTPTTTIDKQVVTKATSPVWKVDMDVVIVLLVTLINLLPKHSFSKHFPVPVTASTVVNPSTFSVSGIETVSSAASGISADQSAESCTTEISLRDSACQTLPGVAWWRKKFKLKV